MCRIRIVTTLAIFLARLSLGATEAKPVMALSTETWDFGTLEQGQMATAEVTVTNKGNADLKITFIRSSCSTCVGNVSGARLIRPGQAGVIVLSFYSKGLSGPQRKVLYVHSNDPVHPFKAIQIVGVVKKGPRPVLYVASDTVDVGLVPAGRHGRGVRTGHHHRAQAA